MDVEEAGRDAESGEWEEAINLGYFLEAETDAATEEEGGSFY